MKKLVSIFGALQLMSSCGASSGVPEKVERPIVKSAAIKSECEEGTSLTYENFGEGFMLSYCVSCHGSEIERDQRFGAPINVNLDTYEDMSIHRRDILKTAARKTNPKMPPSRHVPLEERELLSEWIKCGVPGNSEQIE